MLLRHTVLPLSLCCVLTVGCAKSASKPVSTSGAVGQADAAMRAADLTSADTGTLGEHDAAVGQVSSAPVEVDPRGRDADQPETASLEPEAPPQPDAPAEPAAERDTSMSSSEPAATSMDAGTPEAAPMPRVETRDAAAPNTHMPIRDAGAHDAGSDAQAAARLDAQVAAATDAQIDAGLDAQIDAAADAQIDAGLDARVDAATTHDAAPPDGRLCASCGGCEEIQPTKAGDHIDGPLTYPDPPPTSGPHNPCWAKWGVYNTPVKAERWVHNLEHGGVVLLYNCPSGCATELEQLTQFVGSHKRTLVTGYDKLPVRFAIVSWGHRLVTDCADMTAFSAFYAANFDHGSESNDSQPDPACPP
jgi:hypothetical protein